MPNFGIGWGNTLGFPPQLFYWRTLGFLPGEGDALPSVIPSADSLPVCQRLDKLIARRREKNRLQREKLGRTKRLQAEAALSRPFRKSPLLDFVDDLVHRPPNTEQMRQLKELLLQEQEAIAKLIAQIDKHLE